MRACSLCKSYLGILSRSFTLSSTLALSCSRAVALCPPLSRLILSLFGRTHANDELQSLKELMNMLCDKECEEGIRLTGLKVCVRVCV